MKPAAETSFELSLLLEAIFLKYHYDFRQYADASLRRRLRAALTHFGCDTLSGLQERVLHDPTVFAQLLRFLTVQVSDLFRDPSYFLSIREKVVPYLRTYPSLKVWVAGCATGEEAYSLAIVLAEEGLLDRTLVYATDINPDSVRIAADGVYPDKATTVEIVGDGTTTGDADRLLQLFSNVISNALHHGSGTSVSVRVEGGDETVVVTVRNQGELPAGMHSTIFDPFRRRQNPVLKPGGLGLGLFISQQIAIAHGGTIAAESSNESTVFTVRIPHRSVASRHGTGIEGPKRVLIVDDDESIRDSLQEALEDERYEVVVAANGEDALEVLGHPATRPDVVILDLVLPVMDGWKVYQAMRADRRLADIPVIVSTSNPSQAPSGVTVVAKPLKLDRLLDTVADLWGQEQKTS